MNILVLDPGYSNVKWAVVSGGRVSGPFRLPTAVAEVPAWTALVDMPGDTGEIEWQGKKFLVGEEALMAGLPLPTLTDGFLTDLAIPLFLLKLTAGLPNLGQVVVLISPADASLKPRIETVAKEALGEVRVSFMAQGTGIWFEAGCPSESLVVDVGFNTVDVIYVAGGKLRRDLSFAIHGAGLVSFLEKIERDDPFILARRLEDGDERLRQVVENHYWDWLLKQLEARGEWRRRPTGAKIVAGGGGAYFLKQVKGISIVKKPETANVRGTAKLIIKLQKAQKGGKA